MRRLVTSHLLLCLITWAICCKVYTQIFLPSHQHAIEFESHLIPRISVQQFLPTVTAKSVFFTRIALLTARRRCSVWQRKWRWKIMKKHFKDSLTFNGETHFQLHVKISCKCFSFLVSTNVFLFSSASNAAIEFKSPVSPDGKFHKTWALIRTDKICLMKRRGKKRLPSELILVLDLWFSGFGLLPQHLKAVFTRWKNLVLVGYWRNAYQNPGSGR